MATAFTLPELGENVTSGTVAKILVATGDTIEAGQNVLEIETDKAVAEIPCPLAGKVVEIRAREGQKISSGDVVLLVEESAAPEKKNSGKKTTLVSETKPAAVSVAANKSVTIPPAKQTKETGGNVHASPSVRKMVREHNISLDEIPHSDPTGKVSAQEVLDYVASLNNTTETPSNETPNAQDKITPESVSDKWGEVVLEPMNAIRRKAAEHLTHCWTTIPHVTHFDKADITELEGFRKRYSMQAEKAGARLTVTAFLLKLLPEVFKRFPRMNATVDMEQQQFILKQYVHIGVAVDTPNGLVVPVIRDVNTKSVVDIAIEMAHLAEKARARKLTLDEMQGGGFTVSNLGGMGGYAFTPIINAPETAILGVSRAAMEPVYNGTSFEPRLMLPLSLSYDHRCIDGADAARFMRFLCESLEHPWRLTLGL